MKNDCHWYGCCENGFMTECNGYSLDKCLNCKYLSEESKKFKEIEDNRSYHRS